MRRLMPILALAIVAGPAWTRAGEKVENFTLADYEGKKHTLYDQRGKAVVLVFLGTQCPVANRYPPRLAELQKTYGPRGVTFLGVNANAPETAEQVGRHAREMGIPFPVLLDPDQAVADRLKVQVVPCAIVIDANREIRYRGRIDDHKSEELVKHRYLRDALDAILAGKDPAVAATDPVGCRLQRDLRPRNDAPVTWSGQIAHVMYTHCAACHRPGQVAPFSLLTYKDAKRWAEDAAGAAKDRRMPPWKPANHGVFRDERVMKPEEIALLEKWLEAGCPEGDPAKAPEPPKFSEGWMLGEPDLILTCPEYEVPAVGDDEYRCFTLPTNLDEDKWITAVELRPGNYNVVHHIIGYVDARGTSERLDAADPKPGYGSSGTGPGFIPSGEMSGWAPGNFPYELPDGVGRSLPKGARVVLEMHYHKNGRKEKDRTQIGLHFAKKPIRQKLRWMELINWSFRIPPGAKRHKVTARLTVNENVHLRSIMPHMHLIGREWLVEAELPDQTKKILIHIPDWDFNWQDTYHFKEPIRIPKGTKITATAYYDNSETNPNNPNHPPKTMTWGEQTTDEMCIVFLSYTRDKEDLTRE